MKKLAVLLLLAATIVAAAPATLTPNEAGQGWILLFDGETMFGWTQEVGARWRVENGALISDGSAGYLRTNAAFGDFHLKCEFLAGSGAASGIYLRFDPYKGDPAQSGYEVQLDNRDRDYPTGSLVDHVRVTSARISRNRWHRIEIRAEGDHFTISFDGRIVVDDDAPGSHIGNIGFESGQGGPVRFRNVKLRPLSLDQLFNGRDLSGWTVVKPTPKQSGGIGGMIKKMSPFKGKPKEPQWSVANGLISVKDGPGELASARNYDNFVMQVRALTHAKGKQSPLAGIFLRGDPGVYVSGYEIQIHNQLRGGNPTQPAEFGTGGVRNLQSARRVVSRDNKMFTLTVVAWKRRLSVWVDGYAVTDFEDPRPEGVARVGAGPIGLAHDEGTQFAAVSAAALVQPPPAPAPAVAAAPGAPAAAAPGMQAPGAPPMPAPGMQAPQAAPAQAPQAAPAPQVIVQPPPGMSPAQKAQMAQLTIQAARTQDPMQRAQLYEQILIMDPSNPAAATGLQAAQQEITKGQAQQAKQLAEQVQQAEKERQNLALARVAIEQARGAWLRGDIPEAEKQIAQAKKTNPKDPEIARLDPLIQAEVRKRWMILIGAGIIALLILGGLFIMYLRSRGKKTPYLVVIEGEDKGKRFEMTSDVTHIGAIEEDRGDRNEITVRDVNNKISRFHCEIHCKDKKKYYLVDCRSSNGTFVGKRRLEPGQAVRIKNGAKFSLARVCTLMLRFDTKMKKARLPGGIIQRPYISRPHVPRPRIPRPPQPRF